MTRSGRTIAQQRGDTSLGRLVVDDREVVEAEACVAGAQQPRGGGRLLAANARDRGPRARGRPQIAGGHGGQVDVPARAPEQHQRARARHLDVVGMGHHGEDPHLDGVS